MRAPSPRSPLLVGAIATILALGAPATATAGPAGARSVRAGGDRTASAATSSAPVRRAADRLVAAGAPGVVVIARDGDRELRLARGLANVARRTPMRAGLRFRVGSVTKMFVATRLLQLVGDGRLSLDDTVERWLPGIVPGAGAITVRELLNHSSGLADFEQDLLPEIVRDPQRAWSPRELIAGATANEPTFAPGAGWAYSNTGYLLLGLIVESATGNSLQGELRRGIFGPLRLRRTSLDLSPRIAGPHAHGYMTVGRRRSQDVTGWNPSWAGAAGAIVSTAGELARFQRALLRGRLISRRLLATMETTVSMGAPGERYGLGIWHTRSLALTPTFKLPCGSVWGHNGDIPGYFTNAFSSRDGTRQIVVLVNSDSLSRRAVSAVARLTAAAYCR